MSGVHIFFLQIFVFWCVCGGTEIAGILVRSTFAGALAHDLAVKNHRKF